MIAIQTDLFTTKKLKPQHEAILNYMRTHNGITVLECIPLGCTELRSRIAELRSGRYGEFTITDKQEEINGKWHKRYFLI
jgi:hypothetical protein